MKKPLVKPSIEQIFESIRLDMQYPISNATDNTKVFNPTTSDSNQSIQTEYRLNSILRAEKFVESVASSEKMPFKFVKTLRGTRLKNTKKGLVDGLFYGLLDSVFPGGFGIFPHHNNSNGSNQDKYEESENLKVLYDVANRLELNTVKFFYDPMALIGEGFIFEGELINTFVESLREAMKKEGFKKRVAERKDESKQAINLTKRYIDRLYVNNRHHLYAQSIVLCYYQGDRASKISLKQSDDYLQKYLATLKARLPADCLVGWWWKREYQTELGHRYYLILFRDSQLKDFNPIAVQETYGPLWRRITDEQGDYFFPPAINNWQLNFGTEDFEYGLAGLMFRIQCILMRDIFFRLKLSHKLVRFDMGEMPRLIHGMPTNKIVAPTAPNY